MKTIKSTKSTKLMKSNRRANAERTVFAGKGHGPSLIYKAAFGCMTGLFVMIFALSVFSLSAKADSTEHANEYKYYISHRIEPGESLWTIAGEAMDSEHYDSVQDYIEEIKTVNQMSGDQIQSGNYLMLPYFSEE